MILLFGYGGDQVAYIAGIPSVTGQMAFCAKADEVIDSAHDRCSHIEKGI